MRNKRILFIAILTAIFSSAIYAQQIPQFPWMIPNQPQVQPTPLPPKKEGVKRIGVVLPKAEMGQTSRMQDVGEPFKQAIIAYLAGPIVEVVPLTARLPVQIEAEAKEKLCDFILYSTITQKHKKSSGFGKLLRIAAPAAMMIPGAGMMVGIAATQVAAEAARQSAMRNIGYLSGSNIRAKDEITIEYHLMQTADKKESAANTLKAKAKKDGEDVISPLIEKLAENVLQSAVN